MTKNTAVKRYPEVGEVFELELDADNPENAPLPGMLQAFDYNPEGWRFTGTPLTGKHQRKFKLVQIGYQPNLEAAKKVLQASYGPTPSGQWMKAFKDAYPKSDSMVPVGVADASWISPYGDIHFPCVDSDNEPGFYWTGHDLGERWRWLVAVPDGE